MIGSSHRFHGHNSLRYVYQHGGVLRQAHTILRYTLNKKRDTYRAAVVVSRKVHKSAVQRNRIHRRIYEIIRMHEVNIVLPYDIVLIVLNSSIAEMPTTTLERMIMQQLRKAGILNQSPRVSRDIVNSEKKES